MTLDQKEIQIRFTELLKQFLSEQNENLLVNAYELGRQALKDGVGELEILRIYHQALITLKTNNIGEDDKLMLAMDFLSEFLAPYEMRQRGFKDLIEQLNQQNKQLRQEVELRNEVEIQLKKSKEYFQKLIENAQDLITVLDINGYVKYLSPSLEKILGHKPEKIVGESIFNLINEEDHSLIKEQLIKLTKAPGNSETVEFRIKDMDGNFRYLESNAQFVDEESGVIVNSRDVTERVVAHQKLQESQDKLTVAQQIAHLGNWEWDIKEDKIYWSDELYNIYGVEKKKPHIDLEEYISFIHPNDRENVNLILQNAFKSNEDFRFEKRVIRPDGEMRILYSRGEVVKDDNGEVIKMIGTGQDITQMKEVENQLRHYSEQLKNYMAKEERSREDERIRIAREIHDELGQMLTVLKLDVSLMMLDAQSEGSLQQDSDFMNAVNSITNRIDTIIKSVQRIAKELRPDIFDHLGLDEALQWQAKEFEKRTGIKHTLTNEIENLETLSDERSIAIYRIFQETLTNILRHANATKVDINLKQKKDQLVLSIKDNGEGIDEERIKKSNSLGIVGMRERSQLLRGDITFTGQKGKGTTVTLTIPLEESDVINKSKAI